MTTANGSTTAQLHRPAGVAWPNRYEFSQMSDQQRLDFYLAHLIVTPSGCHEWPGTRRADGYGLLFWEGRLWRAARLLWELEHGPIPEGIFTCHHCDNPPCVRLDHIFLGSTQENTQDSVQKGRSKNPPLHIGESCHLAKLTAAKVLEIRRLYPDRTGTRAEFAAEHGTTEGNLKGIISRHSWRHL